MLQYSYPRRVLERHRMKCLRKHGKLRMKNILHSMHWLFGLRLLEQHELVEVTGPFDTVGPVGAIEAGLVLEGKLKLGTCGVVEATIGLEELCAPLLDICCMGDEAEYREYHE
ncbi:hypothetical protein Tco_0375812 [Tanacetum coccineum]